MKRHKIDDLNLRKKYYKEFFDFMKKSEDKAKKTFFKDKIMVYLKDIELMKKIKLSYLSHK